MELDTVRQLVDNLFLEKFNKHLSDPEVVVLSGAWEGITYTQMAENSQYSENYLMRDIGPNLFRQLKQALGEDVSKANFRAALERHQGGLTAAYAKPHYSQDWGDAPDEAITFYGRQEELFTLKEWIEDQARLVTLSGMGGVGKTLLARKVAEDVKNKFRYVIWRALYKDYQLQTLLSDWLACLNDVDTWEVTDIRKGVSELISCLQAQRCLLVLDNVDAVIKTTSESKPEDQQESDNFNLLFKRVGEKQHQSCLFLISREKLQTIDALESSGGANVMRLQGLGLEEARPLLQGAKLKDEDRWPELVVQARGIPLVLKLTAQYIVDLFDGDVSQFLEKRTWVFDEYFTAILQDQFDSLQPFQKEVIQLIANADQPISLDDLKQNLSDQPAISVVMQALVQLIRIDWVEKVHSAGKQHAEIFYQTPFLIKKYVRRNCQLVEV